MLLFVKKRFVDAIRENRKTLEIRAGARYARLRAGSQVSINGHFRRSIARVEVHPDSRAVLRSLNGRYHRAGCVDSLDARVALGEYYGSHAGPFYILHLKPEF